MPPRCVHANRIAEDAKDENFVDQQGVEKPPARKQTLSYFGVPGVAGSGP